MTDKFKKNQHARAMSKLGASKGGQARAKRLSPEQRQEIARLAAEKRWGTSRPKAIYTGTLKIGDSEFPCAVLSDGTRVLTQSDFMSGMGMYYSGWVGKNRSDEDIAADTPQFLAFKTLKPFVTRHLADLQPITLEYRTQRGQLARGIRAEIIPKICDVWIDANEEAKLGVRQKKIAARAMLLVRALANVGIIALVDEATGYQDVRERDALAKILEAFVAKELRKWVSTFPPEFYQEMFRLRGIKQPATAIKKPRYIGHLTNDVVYKRLAPMVLDELKKRTPRSQSGRHKHQLHRRLTEDVGHPKLREHLASVVTLMRISGDWDEFIEFLDRAHPRWGDTLPLPIG